ncbi:MAG TPA: hypothetical protein VMB52_05210 [Verrucomicrobiae bacterium]|nr:hypothetical protein [Verrucomicrobiae bacterium]
MVASQAYEHVNTAEAEPTVVYDAEPAPDQHSRAYVFTGTESLPDSARPSWEADVASFCEGRSVLTLLDTDIARPDERVLIFTTHNGNPKMVNPLAVQDALAQTYPDCTAYLYLGGRQFATHHEFVAFYKKHGTSSGGY